MYLIRVEVKDSLIDGRGVFTLENIKKGDVLWKFHPNHDKTLSSAEFKLLDETSKESLMRIAYLSRITDRWVYPPEGDPAEFTNHSRKNNMSAVFRKDISEEPIFFANRDISIGEELTNNYEEFDDLNLQDLKPGWI